MQSHTPCWTSTKGKVTTFLNELSLWTKPGLAHTNQTWNLNLVNGSIPALLVQRKCAPHNVLWRWCWLWRMTHAVYPRQIINACLLLHVPAAPRLPGVQEKTTTLGDTEPHHHSSWQCKEWHRCCCYQGPVALLAMGDSGTPTVLTRYESMQLRSLFQSERIAAVQHKRSTYSFYRAFNAEHLEKWTRFWCLAPSKHLAEGDK